MVKIAENKLKNSKGGKTKSMKIQHSLVFHLQF